jgi:hypothetical protein
MPFPEVVAMAKKVILPYRRIAAGFLFQPRRDR